MLRVLVVFRCALAAPQCALYANLIRLPLLIRCLFLLVTLFAEFVRLVIVVTTVIFITVLVEANCLGRLDDNLHLRQRLHQLQIVVLLLHTFLAIIKTGTVAKQFSFLTILISQS